MASGKFSKLGIENMHGVDLRVTPKEPEAATPKDTYQLPAMGPVETAPQIPTEKCAVVIDEVEMPGSSSGTAQSGALDSKKAKLHVNEFNAHTNAHGSNSRATLKCGI